MTANFQEDLKRSHEAEDLPIWEALYREAFPEMVAMVNHRSDGYHQRFGVDRSLTLGCSKQVLIDEKVRYRNRGTGKVYNDVALEYVSNTCTGAPGWVCKPLLADYIAYAIAPLGKCYLLPVPQLQKAWSDNESFWKIAYKTISARNEGYLTLSLVIPHDQLFKAIGQALRLEFTPFES